MKEKILEIQKKLNVKLANFFYKNKIKHFRITSLGNSIATGYSIYRTTKPLLLRNKNLVETLKLFNITTDIYHFARAQNNSDEHMLEWLLTNTKQSDINKLNRYDFNDTTNGLPTKITSDKINEYYPDYIEKDLGLNDIVSNKDANMANVIVYNGCTGTFLDNMSRGSILKGLSLQGFNRDILSLEAILKYINTQNRYNNSNTQVYICGVPNFLGINLSEIVNRKLKKITSEFPNTVYVEPVKSKFFYKELEANENDKLENLQTKIKQLLFKIDIHYDEKEYLKLNNNIISSIHNNYLLVDSLISIDRIFYQFSKKIELEKIKMTNEEIQNTLYNLLITITEKFNSPKLKRKFLNIVKRYLTNRYSYDFYYLGKKNITNSINKLNIK